MNGKQERKLSGVKLREREKERIIERQNADLMPGLTVIFYSKLWTSCSLSDFTPVKVLKLGKQHLNRIAIRNPFQLIEEE